MQKATGRADGHLENNIHNIKFYWAQQGTQRGNWKQYKQIIKLAGQNWLGTRIYSMCVYVCVCVCVCTCTRWASYSFNLESWILDYLVHIAVNDRALKRGGRGEQMADSLSLRQRETIHTSYWPRCLAAAPVLGSKGWLDWFLFILLRALARTGSAGTTYTVKKLCLPGR